MPPEGFELPPELERQLADLNRAATDFHLGSRLRLLRFAALTCTCPRWYTPGLQASQVQCPVHSTFLVMPDGRIM